MNSIDCIKCICFDYYGTVVEINNPFKSIYFWIEGYLRKNEPQIETKKFLSRMTKYRAVLLSQNDFLLGITIFQKTLEKACNYYGIECFCDKLTQVVENEFTTPKAYKDAMYTINTLKERYKVGLITNADNYLLYKNIKREKLQFDFIVSSEDAMSYKPQSKIFKYAIDKLQVKKTELLMIGDSLIDDINGASILNIDTVWVNRYGSKLDENIKPTIIIKNLEDILEYIPKK